ncbi:helix-turn-helix domain-containing protein [Leucobacter denitrificans]|uniref:Helix-turn-helix domain-containing protein n=1 Tax=Leucobacter denitrificans TaxID=683042 RepID=A0A7G9S3G2_9MICO|nr:helix-turn-helix domain-containing protein [Leucobacter denitrificans]QNN62387.1 helix-turn-helix domain-containing protein [Leucobacter denitrificans]
MFLNTGSIAKTSSELFAHRNTVLNRLRRFGELTGIDLRVPAESARVVVAWLG